MSDHILVYQIVTQIWLQVFELFLQKISYELYLSQMRPGSSGSIFNLQSGDFFTERINGHCGSVLEGNPFATIFFFSAESPASRASLVWN